MSITGRTLIALALASATPAMAAKHETRCIPLAEARTAVDADNGVWTGLTTDQFQFLRGVSATHPQTPVGIPLGESAVMVVGPGKKTALVFFIDGDKACDMFAIPEAMMQMVVDIGAGVVKHEGEGL